ncbi:Anhydro-N-acetylmuramic acid kinase [Polaromonas vacuolata]|uniref:Anhydro-N-acetylmuramic acid kinase n=1 Tax=Polaromonas vacuolata TaxID=37448 RepID=A0A6H2HD09_9BURK|nr:anhydro-N-acetylmuramic acid kinase [Polaromonas vacuolata]QJC57758.1 Anhydro-N-acetylmuramic acid kinase [Polaromonas vacuolata]
MNDYFIGLMSGTSLDGVDGVLVNFATQPLTVMAVATEPFEPNFKAELLALNSPAGNELHRAALAANTLARTYARVVSSLLASTSAKGLSPADIQAIGAHGQTVRHQPQTANMADGNGYTIQLNNPALLSELCGIDVVADFRSRDIAAGGQGAPLVPAFHQQVFAQAGRSTAVLNLGGIANISLLPENPATSVLGFDCGPGNALMDAWCYTHTGQAFDSGGAWAASGQLIPALLDRLLAEPYLALPAPKSTGRDLFSLNWLSKQLEPFTDCAANDIQNTLTEFTAKTCIDCVTRYAAGSDQLIVCGGGAYNLYLMERLQAGLPKLRVMSSQEHGLGPLEVEAAAFAWLARQTLLRLPGNLPSATGAKGLRVLGAIYPA